MSIPVSRFISPLPNSQEYNALVKALRENPRVELIGTLDGVKYYQVTSTKSLGVKYPVRIWEGNDKDFIQSYGVVERNGQLYLEEDTTYVAQNGESWVECFCPGASPPFEKHPPGVLLVLTPEGPLAEVFDGISPEGPVIRWIPKVCYHQAAVVLFESQ